MEKQNEVSLICRREIEAEVIAPLIRAFAEEIGEERAHRIAGDALKKIAYTQGKAAAAKFGSGLDSLKTNCLSAWNKCGELELETVNDSKDEYSFNVRRCEYAELYEKLGCRDLGSVISCSRDFAFSEGFDKDIEFKRTKTLMDGGDCCDFCYRRKNG